MSGGRTGRRPRATTIPYMGFGLYCMNCHGSARDNATFASLRNIKGERGDPLVFLSQTFVDGAAVRELSRGDRTRRSPTAAPPPDPPYSSLFTRLFRLLSKARPTSATVVNMPSETYDHVWAPAGLPNARSQMVTSTQCIGCHSAGGTGLQFDMTEPGPDNKMVNVSPYGTWRTSPKGLAGRDPIFFAQLASEIETFHPESPQTIEDTCLGCHAVQGQRQFATDRHAETGTCQPFVRDTSECDPVPGRQRGARARALRGAGARRRLLHHLPQHGARQGGDPRRRNRSRRMPASTRGRNAPIRVSAAWRAPSPAISCSGRPASSTDRSAIPSRSRWSTPPAWCRSTAST